MGVKICCEKTGSERECLMCECGVVGAMGVIGVFGTDAPEASSLGKSLDFVFIRDKERFFAPNRENKEKNPFCGLEYRTWSTGSIPNGASGGVTINDVRLLLL